MSFERWILFAATELFAYLVPGPAVLLVTSRALARGARDAMKVVTGIMLAEVAFFFVSSTGIGILLVQVHELFLALKWIGAAYLIWLGIVTLRGEDASRDATQGVQSPGGLQGVARGFVTNAANPKALLVYVAILPQFIDPRVALAPQLLILGMTSVGIGSAVFGVYALAAAWMTSKLRSPRYSRLTRGGSGVLLIGAGVGVALTDADA